MIKLRLSNIFQKRYYFGCIIFPDELRYVIVKKQPKAIELIDYGKLPLPLKKNAPVKKLCSLDKARTLVGAANELSHLKLLTVAKDLTDGQIDKYVNAYVLRFFKHAKNALYLDYRLILQNLHLVPIEKHQRYVQVLTAKKMDLGLGLSMLNTLNIKFSVLSLEAIALVRLLQYFFKSLPSIYLLVFVEQKKFSIMVVDTGYLIYKKYYRFMSDEQMIKTRQVAQAVTLVQSIYLPVTLEHYIAIGNNASIICKEVFDERFKFFDFFSFIKTNLTKEKLPAYYAAIGLTL